MKILAVDIGTGTQDILLFDSRVDVENSFKLVVPSPTMISHRRIKAATKRGDALALTGVTMGGGPSHWAVEAHLEAGLPVYATPDAARSFNDDLDEVRAAGIEIVGEEEVSGFKGTVLELKDFDYEAITRAFASFEVSLDDLDLIAAAVFDHGAAPPGYSDRQFRFDFLTEALKKSPRLGSFAFRDEEIPEIMTRMLAVASSARIAGVPLMLMDTAPAAVLGAMMDDRLRNEQELLLANVGNFHTIAFRMRNGLVTGIFEHHTGLLDVNKLDGLLEKLASGTITHQEVFDDHGHGALLLEQATYSLDGKSFGVAVTGPRRQMMTASRLNPFFAVPFGDMMMAGCYGLVRAAADLYPHHQEEILTALERGRARPPWELD
jgi:uncharacterized protein (DUF1786 family)